MRALLLHELLVPIGSMTSKSAGLLSRARVVVENGHGVAQYEILSDSPIEIVRSATYMKFRHTISKQVSRGAHGAVDLHWRGGGPQHTT
jgi:hypothetical protein